MLVLLKGCGYSISAWIVPVQTLLWSGGSSCTGSFGQRTPSTAPSRSPGKKCGEHCRLMRWGQSLCNLERRVPQSVLTCIGRCLKKSKQQRSSPRAVRLLGGRNKEGTVQRIVSPAVDRDVGMGNDHCRRCRHGLFGNCRSLCCCSLASFYIPWKMLHQRFQVPRTDVPTYAN